MTETPSPSREAMEIVDFARGCHMEHKELAARAIDAALRKARDDEREQCAKVCEGKQAWHKDKAFTQEHGQWCRREHEEDIRPTRHMATACEECADAIRARGKETNDAQG